MDFRRIPKSRYIQLDLEKLKKYGFTNSDKVFLALAAGCEPYFKMVKRLTERDLSIGVTWLTNKGKMRIPRRLELYESYCITYDSKHIHIMLA